MEERTIRTNILPVVALRGKVAFPNCLISFEVGRERTVRAIERASVTADKLLFICTQKDAEKVDVTQDDLYLVGTVVSISQTVKGNNVYRLIC